MSDPMVGKAGTLRSSARAIINNSKKSTQDQKREAGRVRKAIRALLVGNRDELVETLRFALESLGIRAGRAADCNEATAIISKPMPPDIVFTNTELPDGSWMDVRCLASAPPKAVPTIVVSPVVDINLYLNVMESWAVDFIVPPFERSDLAFIVDSAIHGSSPLL